MKRICFSTREMGIARRQRFSDLLVDHLHLAMFHLQFDLIVIYAHLHSLAIKTYLLMQKSTEQILATLVTNTFPTMKNLRRTSNLITESFTCVLYVNRDFCQSQIYKNTWIMRTLTKLLTLATFAVNALMLRMTLGST